MVNYVTVLKILVQKRARRVYIVPDGSVRVARLGVVLVDAQDCGNVRIAFKDCIEVVVQEVVEFGYGTGLDVMLITGMDGLFGHLLSQSFYKYSYFLTARRTK
jgi:hypothetical protein